MTDTVSKAKRSWIMSRIRSSGTGPERAVAKALRRLRALKGWRRQHRTAGIRLDFAWPSERVALLVHGCFWHACGAHGSVPKSNRRFWRRKIARNRERDAGREAALKARGWRVVVFWEHQVRDRYRMAALAILLAGLLRRKLRRTA